MNGKKVIIAEYEQRIMLIMSEKEKGIGAYAQQLETYKSENLKLQMTIEEMKRKVALIKQYEEKIAMITQELEKQNRMLAMRMEEIETLKSQKYQLELKLQDTSKDMQINTLNGQIVSLKKELESTRAMYYQKEEELQGKLRLIAQYESYKTEISIKEKKIKELEERTVHLSMEIERLNGLYLTASKDLEEYKRKAMEISSLQERLVLVMQENERLQVYKKKVAEYEEKIATLSQEVERSTILYQKKVQEYNALQEEYTKIMRVWNMEKEKSGRVKELEEKLTLLAGEFESQKAMLRQYMMSIQQKDEEIGKLRMQIKQYGDYEGKLQFQIAENKRLQESLELRIKELNEWKMRYSSIEVNLKTAQESMQEFSSLRAAYELRMKEIDEWKKKYSLLDQTVIELRSIQMQVGKYEERISYLMAEQKKYEKLMGDRSNEISRLSLELARAQEMLKELNLCKSSLSQRDQEIEQWKTKYLQLSKGYEEYSLKIKSLSSLEEKLVLVAQEREKYESLYMEVKGECENLRAK